MNKSNVCLLALKYIREKGWNQSEALKMAWRKYRLIAKLKAGRTEFAFKKKSGEIRKAIGTLNTSLFTYEFKGGRPKPFNIVKYWDFERNMFRSFLLENLC